MNEEQKQTIIDGKQAAIDHKQREIDARVEQLELKQKTIDLLSRELDVFRRITDGQIKNFNFSVNWKPTEEWMETDEYKGLAKELQSIRNAQNLMIMENKLNLEKKQLEQMTDDFESLKTSLKMVEEELEEAKAIQVD